MPKISPERSRAQRLRLVEAAIDAFAKQGYDATTVDAVCKASGLSKGSMYTYFPSKQELFLAASEHVFEQRLTTLEHTWRHELPDADLDTLLEAFATSLVGTRTDFLRLWVEGFLVATRIPQLAQLKASYHRRSGELLVEVLAAAQSSGRFDPTADLPAAAALLMAIADGLMLHRIVPGLDPDGEGSVRSVVTMLAPY